MEGFKITIFHLPLDFKKAFNSTDKKVLFAVLWHYTVYLWL